MDLHGYTQVKLGAFWTCNFSIVCVRQLYWDKSSWTQHFRRVDSDHISTNPPRQEIIFRMITSNFRRKPSESKNLNTRGIHSHVGHVLICDLIVPCATNNPCTYVGATWYADSTCTYAPYTENCGEDCTSWPSFSNFSCNRDVMSVGVLVKVACLKCTLVWDAESTCGNIDTRTNSRDLTHKWRREEKDCARLYTCNKSVTTDTNCTWNGKNSLYSRVNSLYEIDLWIPNFMRASIQYPRFGCHRNTSWEYKVVPGSATSRKYPIWLSSVRLGSVSPPENVGSPPHFTGQAPAYYAHESSIPSLINVHSKGCF